MRRTWPRWARGLAWLSPTLLILLWLQRGLLGGEVFFRRDTLLLFLPFKRYLAQALAQGEFPEWWPFDGLGEPFSSIPVASLFHPSTLLYWLLPFGLAFTLQTLLPMVALPVGVWRLARTLGVRGAGAGLAALVAGVSFWNLLIAEFTSMHLAAASLPWMWCEAIRLHRSRRGSPLVLALAVANLVVGGDPMLLELAAVGLVPLLWRWPLRPRALSRVAAAALLGLGLGAVQAVPMVFAFLDSPRSSGLSINIDDYWALRWPQLLGALLPVHHGTDYFFDTLYVGLPVVALAVVGLLTPWRARFRLLALLLLLVVTAFGRATPLWSLWSALLPGWIGYQSPVKALAPALVPLALLAGRGLMLPSRRWALLAAGLGGLWLMSRGVTIAGLMVVAALLIWLAERRPQHRAWLTWGVLLTLGVDVGWHLGAAPTRPWEEVERKPELAVALERAGVGPEGCAYEWAYSVPESMDTRLPHWRELQTEFQALTLAPDSGALFGLPTARAYLAGVTRRIFALRASPQWGAFSPRFGVCARVVTFQGSEPPQGNLFADLDTGAALMPVSGARPRAYLAFTTREVPDEAQVAVLGTLTSDDVGVLVAPGAGLVGGGTARPLQSVAVHRGVDSFSAEVEVDQPALLVINEAWARGWSARVDGAAASLIIADHAVLGVRLPPGRHAVVLEYTTPGLGLGLGVSAVSVLLVLGWLLLPRRGPRAINGSQPVASTQSSEALKPAR